MSTHSERDEELTVLSHIYGPDINIISDSTTTTITLALLDKMAPESEQSHYDPLCLEIKVPLQYRQDITSLNTLESDSRTPPTATICDPRCPSIKFLYTRSDDPFRITDWLSQEFIADANSELLNRFNKAEGGPILFDLIEFIRSQVTFPKIVLSTETKASQFDTISSLAFRSDQILPPPDPHRMHLDPSSKPEPFDLLTDEATIGMPIEYNQSTIMAFAVSATNYAWNACRDILNDLALDPDLRSATDILAAYCRDDWVYKPATRQWNCTLTSGSFSSSRVRYGRTLEKVMKRLDVRNVYVYVLHWSKDGKSRFSSDGLPIMVKAVEDVLVQGRYVTREDG